MLLSVPLRNTPRDEVVPVRDRLAIVGLVIRALVVRGTFPVPLNPINVSVPCRTGLVALVQNENPLADMFPAQIRRWEVTEVSAIN